MFSADENKMQKNHGKYFDKFLDPIGIVCDQNSINWIHVSRPLAKIYGKKSFSNAYEINKEYLLAYFLDSVLKYDAEIDELKYNSKSFRVQLFNRLLIKIKPKAILSINYLPELALAAKNLNIPLIEVLHGKGYTTKPTDWLTHGKNNLIFPSHVASFDSVSSDLIRRELPKINVIDVEDIPFNFYKEQSLSENLVIFKKNRLRVLVTLQWGFDGEVKSLNGILNDGLLPNGLIGAIKELGDKFDWRIRLHPVQMHESLKLYSKQKRYLKSVFRGMDNVSLELTPEKNIYESLGNVDFHITTGSMTVFEAAQMNVVSLVLNKSLDGAFDEISKSNWLYFAEDSSKEIVNWLLEQPKKPDRSYLSKVENQINLKQFVESLCI